MTNQTKITNLKSLKLARTQLKAKALKSEIEIHSNLEVLKYSLFTMSGSNGSESAAESFLNISPKELSRIVSSFIISKWIKPKSKLVKKASIFFSSLLLQKYSSKIIKAITKLIDF